MGRKQNAAVLGDTCLEVRLQVVQHCLKPLREHLGSAADLYSSPFMSSRHLERRWSFIGWLFLAHLKDDLIQLATATGCGHDTSRSHIVFAPFQDASFSFLVSNLFGWNLVGEMMKDQEVAVAERRDNEEKYHFVGSHNLEKMSSENFA